MPERLYLDTVAFRQFGKAFATTELPDDLKNRMLISPITVFEVLSQFTVTDGDAVLHEFQGVLNWTNRKNAGLIAWPDDALYGIWYKKNAPQDDFKSRMEKALNTCLAADSVAELRAEAGKLKDVMDGMKQRTAGDFERLLEAARKEPMDDESFSKAWFQGIANRVKADAKSREMNEIITELSAYHEFEREKLKVGLAHKEYNAERHSNDLLDAEQLIYLSDPSLCFLTCDKGFGKIKESPQAKRIVIVTPPDDLAKPTVVDLVKKILGA